MIYASDYGDRITSVLTGTVTPEGRDVVQSVNAADSSIHGVEAGADIELTDAFSLSAVLNYTWGEQRVEGMPMEPADRIPPLGGRLNIAYDPGGNFRVDGWLRFAGAQDRLSARDIQDVRIDPTGTSRWAILGARASWVYRDWRFTLGLDNLLDKRYRTHGSGLDAPGHNLILSVRRTW